MLVCRRVKVCALLTTRRENFSVSVTLGFVLNSWLRTNITFYNCDFGFVLCVDQSEYVTRSPCRAMLLYVTAIVLPRNQDRIDWLTVPFFVFSRICCSEEWKVSITAGYDRNWKKNRKIGEKKWIHSKSKLSTSSLFNAVENEVGVASVLPLDLG